MPNKKYIGKVFTEEHFNEYTKIEKSRKKADKAKRKELEKLYNEQFQLHCEEMRIKNQQEIESWKQGTWESINTDKIIKDATEWQNLMTKYEQENTNHADKVFMLTLNSYSRAKLLEFASKWELVIRPDEDNFEIIQRLLHHPLLPGSFPMLDICGNPV
jgi:hypothetical protein